MPAIGSSEARMLAGMASDASRPRRDDCLAPGSSPPDPDLALPANDQMRT
jgi:hypothetical protein